MHSIFKTLSLGEETIFICFSRVKINILHKSIKSESYQHFGFNYQFTESSEDRTMLVSSGF